MRKIRHPIGVLRELVRIELRLRYGGSLLGLAWIFLKPLLLFVVLYAVFSNSSTQDPARYPILLLIGVVAYNTFAEGTRMGMHALSSKRHLLTKLPLPPLFLLLSSLATAVTHYIVWVVILVLVTLWTTDLPSTTALWLLLPSLSLLTLILTFALPLSLLQVRFSDTAEVWDIVLLLLFITTPIFYSLNVLSARTQAVLSWQPLARIVEESRGALLSFPTAPSSLSALMTLLVLVLLCVMSFLLFSSLSSRIADEY